jgi:hypothetical protein
VQVLSCMLAVHLDVDQVQIVHFLSLSILVSLLDLVLVRAHNHLEL